MFGIFKNAKEASDERQVQMLAGASQSIVPPARMGETVTVIERPFVAAAPEKPQPIKVELPVIERHEEYEKLASELGFAPTALQTRERDELRRNVLEFILDNGWPIFDMSAVMAYLKPFADKETERRFNEWNVSGSHSMHDWLGRGAWETKVVWVALAATKERWVQQNGSVHEFVRSGYDKLIPFDILQRVKAIKDKFGSDAVAFTVSDYAAPNPDPFIAVTPKGSGPIIFGVWDEPGFGLDK